MIKDFLHHFSTAGSAFAPTATGDNLAPNTFDTSPFGLPSGSGGSSALGYDAGSSTNAGRDLGIGTEMWFVVVVIAAVTSSGAATVKFDLVTDATATLASVVDSTGVGVLLSSPVIPKATLVAGYQYAAQPPASASYLKFLGADVVIATQTLSAGSFDIFLTPNVQQSDLYLGGFAVQ